MIAQDEKEVVELTYCWAHDGSKLSSEHALVGCTYCHNQGLRSNVKHFCGSCIVCFLFGRDAVA